MRKSVYINSSNRDIGTIPENFTITIDRADSRFSYPPRSVKLTSANIPYTWNNITVENNQFNLIEPPGFPIPITIAPGNYNGTTLAAAVQTALNSSGAAYTYTVSFDSTTLLFTFDSSSGNFILDFDVSNTIATKLGFPNGYQTISNITTVSTQLASLLVDTELFICSDLVGGIDNGFANLTPGPPVSNQILAVVNITGCFGGVIEFRSRDDDPFYPIVQSEFGDQRKTIELRSMRFFLRFPSGFPLDLGDQNWSMTLAFQF
jgi:hypothetical protein